jgi:hypothetical protein
MERLKGSHCCAAGSRYWELMDITRSLVVAAVGAKNGTAK